MRVGVTGATGFLGSHLSERLLANGCEVVALCRATADRARLRRLGARIAIGDVTDEGSVAAFARECDAVIHAAGVVGDTSAARVNVEGTRFIARSCRSAGSVRLVFVSSVGAIGVPDDGAVADETFAFNVPRTRFRYYASKHCAEAAVLSEVQRGLDAVIVNPAWIHGEYGPQFRGAEPLQAVQRRRLVPYYAGGRNVVHVEDAVGGILAALSTGISGERYILGGENLSCLRMAQVAAEELSLRRIFVRVPTAVTAALGLTGVIAARIGAKSRFPPNLHLYAPRHLYYSSAKAQAELGYSFRPYREIVRDYLRWCLSSGPSQPTSVFPERASTTA